MEMRQDFLLTPDVMDSIALQRVSFLQPPKQSWGRAGLEIIYLNSQQLLSSATLEPLTYSLQAICKQPGKGLFVLTKHLGSASVC